MCNKQMSREERQAAGRNGQNRLEKVLKDLKERRVIVDYIPTTNMVFVNGKYEYNFQLDSLVLVPDYGAVLIEGKFYAGHTYCTGDQNVWEQDRGDGKEERGNASKQVLRARTLVQCLLERQGMEHWVINPLVVFTNKNGTVFTHREQPPETEVIRLGSLESWIRSLPRDTGCCPFTRKVVSELRLMFADAETPFNPVKH